MTIGAFGKNTGANPSKRDDILDQGESQGFRDSPDGGPFAGFDNRGPQDDNPDRRTGGRSQQGQAGEAAHQAELATRAGDFQRSMNAALQNASDPAASETGIPGQSDNEKSQALDPISGLLNGGFNRSGQQAGHNAMGQPSLSELFAHKNNSNTNSETESELLLASSIASGSTIPMFNALQQVEAVQAPGSIARAQDIASAIEGRVTQAIKAELAATSSSITSISVNLTGLVEGLNSITIRMSATGLDVVLSGTVELAGEAQSLADRLSKRFSNRNVRILSSPSASEGATDNEGGGNNIAMNSPIKRLDSLT